MSSRIYQKDKITRVQVKLRPEDGLLKEDLNKVKVGSNTTISKLIMIEIEKLSKEEA